MAPAESWAGDESQVPAPTGAPIVAHWTPVPHNGGVILTITPVLTDGRVALFGVGCVASRRQTYLIFVYRPVDHLTPRQAEEARVGVRGATVMADGAPSADAMFGMVDSADAWFENGELAFGFEVPRTGLRRLAARRGKASIGVRATPAYTATIGDRFEFPLAGLASLLPNVDAHCGGVRPNKPPPLATRDHRTSH